MDAGIPEIDVHEIRIPPQEHAPDDFELASVHQGRSSDQILQPPPTDRTWVGAFKQLQILKWIERCIFPNFRDNKCMDPLQRSDLTIDVKHLRLEKIGAKTGNDRFHFEFGAAAEDPTSSS